MVVYRGKHTCYIFLDLRDRERLCVCYLRDRERLRADDLRGRERLCVGDL